MSRSGSLPAEYRSAETAAARPFRRLRSRLPFGYAGGGGIVPLREQLRREPLSFRDPLDLDGDRIDRLLHALEPSGQVGRNGGGAPGILQPPAEGFGERDS